MTILYRTEVTAIGGRAGCAASADGTLRLRLSAPVALGGTGGAGTNPEQLFGAGYAACFLSALKFAALHCGIDLPADASVTASVALGIEEGEDGVPLDISLALDLPGLNHEAAKALAEAAHRACPYSRALAGGIDVRTSIA